MIHPIWAFTFAALTFAFGLLVAEPNKSDNTAGALVVLVLLIISLASCLIVAASELPV
jgi:hypothetical protein